MYFQNKRQYLEECLKVNFLLLASFYCLNLGCFSTLGRNVITAMKWGHLVVVDRQ